MGTLNWKGGSGSQSWATAANWDTGAVPIAGDNVNILTGNSDINAGLDQHLIALASLTVAGSFTGTIGTSGATGDALQITPGILICDCQTGRFRVDLGTSTGQTIVAISTATAIDAGHHALEVRGGGTTCKVYVTGSADVGIATGLAGLTATIPEWDVEAGTLEIGAGTTWTTGNQSGGNVTTNSGGTLIQQSGNGASLTTKGTAAITTIDVTGKAKLNHRPAAGTDAIATLSIGPDATADVSADPRPLTLTNPILMARGATFIAFNPSQAALHAAALQVRTQQCGLEDVTIEIGAPVLATLAVG